LHNLWVTLFGLIASLWVVQGIRAGIGMSRLPWLSDANPISPDDTPFVSIIFAARDEAEKLPAALATLLTQDYPRFEVIAVNDRSQDLTSSILHQFERTCQNLKVTDLHNFPQFHVFDHVHAQAAMPAALFVGRAPHQLDVIEDMKLGKIVKMAGFRSGVAVAQDSVKVRWHSGVHNVVRGVTKNFFAACHYNIFIALAAMMLPLLMSVLPFFGLAFASGWARVFAGIAVGSAILIHTGMIWSTDASPLYGFTHPLGALLFSWMLARSAIATLWRGGVVWRDTFYPIEDLRKGLV